MLPPVKPSKLRAIKRSNSGNVIVNVPITSPPSKLKISSFGANNATM